MNPQQKNAAEIARTDLQFTLDHPDMLKNKYGRQRLEQSIRMLTEALGDAAEFKKLKDRWDSESPDRFILKEE